jgi:hypothetical protein
MRAPHSEPYLGLPLALSGGGLAIKGRRPSQLIFETIELELFQVLRFRQVVLRHHSRRPNAANADRTLYDRRVAHSSGPGCEPAGARVRQLRSPHASSRLDGDRSCPRSSTTAISSSEAPARTGMSSSEVFRKIVGHLKTPACPLEHSRSKLYLFVDRRACTAPSVGRCQAYG